MVFTEGDVVKLPGKKQRAKYAALRKKRVPKKAAARIAGKKSGQRRSNIGKGAGRRGRK